MASRNWLMPRQFCLSRPSEAEIVVDLAIIRFEAEGCLEFADGPSSTLAFVEEGIAEIVMGLGIIRFEAESRLKLADGFFYLAFLVEGVAEVVVGSA